MDSRLSGIAEKKLKEPTSYSLLYESTRTDWDAADPGQTFAPRHSQRGNVTFADGHAKARTLEDFQKETR
jgi:prepilin-type processing-associated H-X9-DG protein